MTTNLLDPLVAAMIALEDSPPQRGERGLQGDPGRDGHDGEDGKAGLSVKGEKGDQGDPGRDGTDGRDGIDGKDGKRGQKGDKGDQGEKGEPGLSATVLTSRGRNPGTTGYASGIIVDDEGSSLNDGALIAELDFAGSGVSAAYANGKATVTISSGGGAPSGPAGGDLSGTYPNPSVVDDSHAHGSSTVTLTAANVGAAAANILTTITVRQAAGVPSGAPSGTELPIAFDTTATTGGLYVWSGAAWVYAAPIPPVLTPG